MTKTAKRRAGASSPRNRTEDGPAHTAKTREPTERSAHRAGLCYVHDHSPGLSRRKKGDGFAYYDSAGRRVRDAKMLARIKSLAIPPAWKDVWISPHPAGHLQATGRDARGRKQSRYHPSFREVRDETKYGRVIAFAKALSKSRSMVRRHLKRPGLSRERVLATVVALLEKTLIRVGGAQKGRLTAEEASVVMLLREKMAARSTPPSVMQRSAATKHL